jgi:hypothetical protein
MQHADALFSSVGVLNKTTISQLVEIALRLTKDGEKVSIGELLFVHGIHVRLSVLTMKNAIRNTICFVKERK